VRFFPAIFLLLATGVAGAEVRIDAYAEPQGDVYAGQRVRLTVDIRTDTWFTTAPRYPELKIDGTIALLPEAFGINFTEREGSTTWAGQRQRYVLFPQRVGPLTVPPIDVPLAVSTDGKAGETQVLTTPSVTINVVAPPGSADVPSFVTTPRLRVSEEWQGQAEDLKVGDAITRRITQSADDVFALLLPAIEFENIEGFAVYPGTPQLDDRVNRGSYTATRTDQVTYVMQTAGDYEFPAIEIHWFDLSRKRMTTETLEALEVTVLPNPDAVLGEEQPAEEASSIGIGEVLRGALDWIVSNVHWLTLLAGAWFALRSLWRRFVPGWIQSLRDAVQRYRQSEARYFNELLRAVRSGDEDRIVVHFWRWADRLPGRTPPLSLHAIEQNAGASGIADTWRAIEERRYRTHRSADAPPLRITTRELKQLRHALLRGVERSMHVSASSVPDQRLNP
jgi:hypothetical protein